MLPIGYNNIFYGNLESQNGIPKVLEMYDDDYNWIFLHRTSSVLVSKILHRATMTYSPSKLNQFGNGNHLFRVDMVVVESDMDILSQLRKYIKVPIIVVTKNISKFKLSNYDYSYEFGCKPPPNTGKHYVSPNVFHFLNRYFVKLNGEDINIDDLKIAFIRDKKIDNLLG